jgi:hypothetical protein
MSVHIDKRAASVTSIPNGNGQSCDGKFKLMVIKYAEKTSNATRKLVGMEANIGQCRQQKQGLKNAN